MAIKWIDNRIDSDSYLHSEDIIATEGQQIFLLKKPYVKGIYMLDVYVNGVYQQMGVYVEHEDTSIRFLDGTYIHEGDVVSIRFRNSTVNLGDLLVVSTYPQLTALQDVSHGKVAIVTAMQKMFQYDIHLGWKPFLIPYTTKNVGLMFQYEEQFISDPTSKQFDLTSITYSPNVNSLLVFIDGKKVDPSSYIEVDSQTVLFNDDLPTDSIRIEFLSVDTESWDETFSHTVEYLYLPNENISGEIIKIGDNIVKQTMYTYDSNDNITTETITKGSKTIVKTYEYDLLGNLTKILVNVVT